MLITLAYAVSMFCEILITALVVRAILSWFARDYSSPIGKIYGFFIKFTEPFVAPFRNFLSRFNTGMFDFSLLLALVAIEFARNIVIRLLLMLAATIGL